MSENIHIIDNINNTLKDDLTKEIRPGSSISVAAAYFSIYAYSELKKELENVEEFRFLFTSPSFTTEKAPKENREFYIPKHSIENSLYGTEFEVKLRNELSQKAIAKECAEWIKKKAKFRTNISGSQFNNYLCESDDDDNVTLYQPVNGFTTTDLGTSKGNTGNNLISCIKTEESKKYLDIFNEFWSDSERCADVTAQVLENITAAYKDNSPEYIYYVTLYNIFSEFLRDINDDELPNEKNGFKESKIWNLLYDFQKDAVLAIINKLEKYNGCILADSVGLGKTFTALAVAEYYENRNQRVLVLCPKKLYENWNTYKANYDNNPIAEDRLSYDVLYHTDLSRDHGMSNGIDLARIKWSAYSLVIIDESHNFRNGANVTKSNDEEKQNRYLILMNKIIKAGGRTKVLMLSATPVNNRFSDLKNQLALAYEGNSEALDEKLNTTKPIDKIFSDAQHAFTEWGKYPPASRTTDQLLSMLDFDFFELLDSVTIARSRNHIRNFYDTSKIGSFPERKKPISMRPDMTELNGAVTYKDISDTLNDLGLEIYTPSLYIQKSKLKKYIDENETNITVAGREEGIRRLMAINLLKRLESSIESFRITVKKIDDYITSTIESIDEFQENYQNGDPVEKTEFSDAVFDEDMDADDENSDFFTFGKKNKIDIRDMDYLSWEQDLDHDKLILDDLLQKISDITPEHDKKLNTLLDVIDDKISKPINEGNKKILIFTAFADTANYLYNNLADKIYNRYGIYCAEITGSTPGKSNVPKLRSDFNEVLTAFSPVSKNRKSEGPDVDILIATDCISEGQNLQDCDCCINYDIHWNPVRIIQRFGRIDRIGSRNKYIQLVNFWPAVSLDEYINLKERVENRMRATIITSTGDDDLINDEKGDLEYRRDQLKRLQDEVVDIEDMSSGISILDLGLNEFKLELMDYVNKHPDIEKAPHGMCAVTKANDNMKPGVIYVLRNVNGGININDKNRLHPYYLVYISDDGEIQCNHLAPKKTLETMRLICKDRSEPIKELCKQVNRDTKDGRNMKDYSNLLGDAISSVINVSDESEIMDFIGGGQVSFDNSIKGLDDFELISFLIIK